LVFDYLLDHDDRMPDGVHSMRIYPKRIAGRHTDRGKTAR